MGLLLWRKCKMARIDYKSYKFPLKLAPTLFVTAVATFTMSLLVIFVLDGKKDYLDLSKFKVQEISYEFQTILENDSFEEVNFIKELPNEICEFYAQSGSFRTFEAAQSQVVQLDKIGYEAFPEKVRSSNDFNYRVIVGPFENKSEMNNAREDFRRLNMDSREIKNCKKISDVSD